MMRRHNTAQDTTSQEGEARGQNLVLFLFPQTPVSLPLAPQSKPLQFRSNQDATIQNTYPLLGFQNRWSESILLAKQLMLHMSRRPIVWKINKKMRTLLHDQWCHDHAKNKPKWLRKQTSRPQCYAHVFLQPRPLGRWSWSRHWLWSWW